MKQKWLHRKLRSDCHYSRLDPEIEQSVDLGRSISVSPSWTFYYSRDTGLQYIRNVQIVRVYGELVFRRYGTSYIIIENNERGRVKIKGTVNYFQLRTAYDRFCPRILIGEMGKEMDFKQLQAQYRVRKRVLAVAVATALCWTLVCLISKYLPAGPGVVLLTLSTALALMMSVCSLRLLMRAERGRKAGGK